MSVGHVSGARDGVRALAKLDNGLLASVYSCGRVKVWNVSTGECVSTFVDDDQQTMTFAGDQCRVHALAKLDGGLLVSGASDGSMKVWVPSGEADLL